MNLVIMSRENILHETLPERRREQSRIFNYLQKDNSIKNEGKLPITRIELAETKSSTIIYEEDSN